MAKKILDGIVVSDKMDKTGVVLVSRRYAHPKYGKVVSTSKKYHFHDEKNVCKVGYRVKIIESRPLSKTKTWQLHSVVSVSEDSSVQL